MHIPPGFTTLFPYIFAEDAKAYLAFLTTGLGGEVLDINESPDGMVRNAHVRFGDTTIMVSEAGGGMRQSQPRTRLELSPQYSRTRPRTSVRPIPFSVRLSTPFQKSQRSSVA